VGTASNSINLISGNAHIENQMNENNMRGNGLGFNHPDSSLSLEQDDQNGN